MRSPDPYSMAHFLTRVQENKPQQSSRRLTQRYFLHVFVIFQWKAHALIWVEGEKIFSLQ